MSAQRQSTQYEKQEPTFYARIPKMCSMDLDPYELALYCNYKQTAAEKGTSWKSNKTLAKETQMSVSKVQRARKSLAEKGLIALEYISDENGVVNQTVNVTIVDVWDENHKRYTQDTPPMYVVPTPHVQDTQGYVPDTTKEEPSSKNQENKTTTTAREEPSIADKPKPQKQVVVDVDFKEVIDKYTAVMGVKSGDVKAISDIYEDYPKQLWIDAIQVLHTERQKQSIKSNLNFLKAVLRNKLIDHQKREGISKAAKSQTDKSHNTTLAKYEAEQRRIEQLRKDRLENPIGEAS